MLMDLFCFPLSAAVRMVGAVASCTVKGPGAERKLIVGIHKVVCCRACSPRGRRSYSKLHCPKFCLPHAHAGGFPLSFAGLGVEPCSRDVADVRNRLHCRVCLREKV